MKQLLTYWKEYHKDENVQFQLFGVTVLLIGLFIFNYTLDFEDSVIDSYRGSPIRILWFFLFNGVAYFIAMSIIHIRTGILKSLNWKAMLLITSGLLILSIDRSLYRYLIWLKNVFEPENYQFYMRILNNIQSLFSICFILLLIWFIDRPNEKFGLYGLRMQGVNFKLYFYLFLMMIPIIFLACLLPDIQEYYPTYKRSAGELWAEQKGVPEYIAVLLYEIAYVLDFISVELLFRGFFVIGVSRYLGKSAILPMVTIYAMLHFGKPIGEAISSVFGGYILGILALYSRNIWGGVVLHAGIAVLMEIFALII